MKQIGFDGKLYPPQVEIPEVCPKCGGEGAIGLIESECPCGGHVTVCSFCDGTGVIAWADPCPECRGYGKQEEYLSWMEALHFEKIMQGNKDREISKWWTG